MQSRYRIRQSADAAPYATIMTGLVPSSVGINMTGNIASVCVIFWHEELHDIDSHIHAMASSLLLLLLVLVCFDVTWRLKLGHLDIWIGLHRDLCVCVCVYVCCGETIVYPYTVSRRYVFHHQTTISKCHINRLLTVSSIYHHHKHNNFNSRGWWWWSSQRYYYYCCNYYYGIYALRLLSQFHA